ncbi:MAG: trehalose-phosphatase [Actinomycetota bacterium]
MSTSAHLDRFRSLRDRAGIFLDFDGTLADIVARPELARAHPESSAVLARLAGQYALVAVVSGRPPSQVLELIDVPGIEVFGLYGLSEARDSAVRAALPEVERAIRRVAGAWIEDKGPSLAVHYRGARDPATAERELTHGLTDIAGRFGLSVLPGKMVLELAPRDTPGKGAVVLRECRSRGLEGCLYAGDDRADLEAFAALDRLQAEGMRTLKLAVRSEGTPAELAASADLVVEGPAALVALLREL